MSTRLERSTTNKVIAGVCGGLAEYLQVDPTLVRVVFVIAGLLTAGVAFLGYLVLVVLMPLPGRPTPFVTSSTPASGEPSADAAGQSAAPVASPSDPVSMERRRATFGYFLVALGVVFLLSNLGAFRIVRWDLVWPLVLVGAGVLLLAQRVRL
ncbi:MAG TPA: PspC domain-containing protein [Candidatus Limnocylindria bacterium]|jgi:phage shock protein C